ncbi:MAG: hypothetical protein LBR44_06955 [Clostridiales Family XIII bacterium]|jgi:cell division protein FtsB|nr:hypothetical protein [Clostridiales Family XIII bacterium]
MRKIFEWRDAFTANLKGQALLVRNNKFIAGLLLVCAAAIVLFLCLWGYASYEARMRLVEVQTIKEATSDDAQEIEALTEARLKLEEENARLQEEKAALKAEKTMLEAKNGDLSKKFNDWSRPG